MKKTVSVALLSILFLFQSQAQAAPGGVNAWSAEKTDLTSTPDAYLLLAKKGGNHGGDDDDDDGHPGRGHKNKKWKKKHHDDDDDGHKHKKKGKRGKGHKKHDYHSKNWKPYHNRELPDWAQNCGLPPGLAKQNKIPPGWERKCRSGHKYYEHEDEFRKDVEDEYKVRKGSIDKNSPAYQTIFKMDDAACKVEALEEAGSIVEGVAKGAVYGGVLGAATGVIIEAVQEDGNAESGAIYGATGGAAGGAVLGGVLASESYKDNYRNCMHKRGHRVD